MYQLKSKQTSRRHDRGRDSSSQQQAQPQAAYPPQAATAAGAQSQSQGLSQSIPTPVTSSTPTPGQHPDAYAELLNPALQQSPTNRSLGASFDQSRTPTAAATGSSMTSGLNATMLMASNVQAVSASMPLLKKASLKPSVAVKLGQKYTKLFEQIRALEILYSNLYTQVDLYHVRSAVLRNTGDEVALMFAMMARVSGPTFKTSLEQVARSVGIVQDYRHAEIMRLKAKVLDTLAKYGPKLKQIKGEMKRLEKAILGEQKARVAYNKKLAGSTTPLVLEKARAAHQVKLGVAEQQKKSFDTMISEFESSRLDTLKNFMKDYLHLEMLFHAKVLDFYTAAYKSIDDMHPEIDFADFKRVFLENAIDAPMGLQGTQAFGATTSSSAFGATTGLSTMSSTGPPNGRGALASGSLVGAPGQVYAPNPARAPAAGTANLEYEDYTDEDEDEDVELEDYDDSSAPPTASSLGGGAGAAGVGMGQGVRMGPATVPPAGARPPGQAAFNGGATASSMTVTTSTTNRTSYR